MNEPLRQGHWQPEKRIGEVGIVAKVKAQFVELIQERVVIDVARSLGCALAEPRRGQHNRFCQPPVRDARKTTRYDWLDSHFPGLGTRMKLPVTSGFRSVPSRIWTLFGWMWCGRIAMMGRPPR